VLDARLGQGEFRVRAQRDFAFLAVKSVSKNKVRLVVADTPEVQARAVAVAADVLSRRGSADAFSFVIC
jgi:hypothetical protein